jgi:hypothetical protein
MERKNYRVYLYYGRWRVCLEKRCGYKADATHRDVASVAEFGISIVSIPYLTTFLWPPCDRQEEIVLKVMYAERDVGRSQNTQKYPG